MDATTPPDWGKDRLSDFIDRAHHNCVATFANHRNMFDKLSEIDAIFDAASRIPFRPAGAEVMLPAFLGRARGAFLAAVRLSISGQVAESYMVARGCLENALYAFYIHGNPEIAEAWLKRGTSEEATRISRRKFQMAKIKSVLERACPDLAQRAVRLYERTIRLGAHPNPDGHLTTSVLSESGGVVDILKPGDEAWKVAVQTSAEVGICALYVFERVFGDRFKDAGISQRLHSVDCFRK